MGVALEHMTSDQRRASAEKLFTVTNQDSAKGELHGRCPLTGHEDNKPSFSYNYEKDVYKCLGCGGDGDLAQLWTEVTGRDFKTFCEEHSIPLKGSGKGCYRPRSRPRGTKKTGVDPKPKPEKIVPENQYEALGPLPERWVGRLEVTRGWTPEIIEELGIRLGRSANQMDDRVCIPIRDGQGRLLNIRQYMPGAKEFKILPWTTVKDRTKINYGTNRLFPDPSSWKDGRVWLCEGEPDTITALAKGLNAVTQTAGAGSWNKTFSRKFRGRDVVIVYDSDKPGAEGALKTGQEIAREAKQVRAVKWPQFMTEGQDLTDWFVKHEKTVRDLEDLAAQGRIIEPPKEQDLSGGYWRFFREGSSGHWSFKPALLVEELLLDFKLLSDPESGLVYRYTGEYWERIHKESLAKAALQKLEIEGTDARANGAAAQAVTLSGLNHGDEMNPDPELICLKNGMFNTTTGQVTCHDPRHRSSYQLPLYFDPRRPAKFPTWKKFLTETVGDAEVIDLLAEFFGYSLTRHCRYERWLLLVGPRASGKSTALKVLRAMVGPENCSSVPLSGLEDQFQRAMLYNKVLNLGFEVEGRAINSEYLKAIVSGDSISAAFKHQDGFDFEPFAKLVFAANKFPQVRDNSSGFFGKLIPIRFENGLAPDERDPDLLAKLLEELPGIFGWAWAGLVRLTERGYFKLPKPIQGGMADYRLENSHVAAFLSEWANREVGAETPKSLLYEQYTDWAGDNGIKRPLTSPFFSRALREEVPGLKERKTSTGGGKRVMHWVGLRMLTIKREGA